MASTISLVPIFSLAFIVIFVAPTLSQLSPNFYQASCPQAVDIIGAAVKAAVSKEPRMGASLLRLHFHDCFVNGCDGSVLLDDTPTFTGEKTAAPNQDSLRGFDVIDTIKTRVESVCKQVVSCADILAVAARDSVVALGGPSWNVDLGRRDGRNASVESAEIDLPSPNTDLATLIIAFSNKGLSATDMVALSGAHTIGQARCANFRFRIYNESNIDPDFARSVQSNCPLSDGRDNLSPIDVGTPTSFDVSYYRNLVRSKGLFHSDQQLFGGGSTDAQVRSYAENREMFFDDFVTAMVKMGNISTLTGSDGEIRGNCRLLN